jgi:rfaE bifunctional protein nucleotidyltransferase chain/domain
VKTIFTNGCFDILHRGHFELLKYCKSLGSTVVAGINSDVSVKILKGETRPHFSQEDRKFALEACKFVDNVIIFNEETPYNLIKKIQPDIIVKGGDYKPEDVIGNDLAQVKIFNFVDGYSTSSVLEKKNNDFQKYVFDIDGTICTLTNGDYEKAQPLLERITINNKLYDEGKQIIYHTARGMGRFKNNRTLAEDKFWSFTHKQLESWGVKFHGLWLGKPAGDIYIDDKGKKDENFYGN